MARRQRNLILALLLLVVIAEVGLSRLRAPIGYVRLINQGTTPLEEVRLTSGHSQATVSKIEPGSSVQVSLAGHGQNPLTVSFQQQDNPLSRLEIPVFDPAELQSEGSCLVLVIRPNEYERYQDVVDPSLFTRLPRQAMNWLEQTLVSP